MKPEPRCGQIPAARTAVVHCLECGEWYTTLVDEHDHCQDGA